MTTADLQIRHTNAKTDHTRKQRVAGMLHAAKVLSANMPTGLIQQDTVEKIVGQLRVDAARLDQR